MGCRKIVLSSRGPCANHITLRLERGGVSKDGIKFKRDVHKLPHIDLGLGRDGLS